MSKARHLGSKQQKRTEPSKLYESEFELGGKDILCFWNSAGKDAGALCHRDL